MHFWTGQQSLINQGKYIYRNFDAVRQTILDHTVETINTVGKDFFENAADLLRNLVTKSVSYYR